jgi:hypothetical protein
MHLFPSAYKGQVRKKIPRNCGAFAPYFFHFPFLPWKSDDEMSFNKFILISLALHLADNEF